MTEIVYDRKEFILGIVLSVLPFVLVSIVLPGLLVIWCIVAAIVVLYQCFVVRVSKLVINSKQVVITKSNSFQESEVVTFSTNLLTVETGITAYSRYALNKKFLKLSEGDKQILLYENKDGWTKDLLDVIEATLNRPTNR